MPSLLIMYPENSSIIILDTVKNSNIIIDMRQKSIIRRQLDARFEKLRPVANFASKPSAGWVRSIRQGLGMSTAQLAARIGVSQPRIVAMEHSEAQGAINLKTLQRAAEALDCTLVYALVPNKPLEQVVRDRARAVAAAQLATVEHTMRLENQPSGDEARDAQLRDAAEILIAENPRALWNHR